MAIDRIDVAAFVGFAALAVAATTLEGTVVAAAAGGLLLSVSIWRLYGGRPWEAIGWLAWVGAAVTLVVDLAGVTFLVAFGGFVLVGGALLVGSRLGVLIDVWSVDGSAEN
ncbi:hypothetical protein AB7C87_19860 [Natrarchaeobius sp. A-rgal3]|uniref:hypothetical protein n=1 Tax=Natrarchaeobius versutus TaxID=1679078 RepID=UPI00350F4272